MKLPAAVAYVLVAGAISVDIIGRLFQGQRRYTNITLPGTIAAANGSSFGLVTFCNKP